MYTMEYFSTTVKDKVKQFAAMWKDLEHIMQSENRGRETDSE